MNIIEILICIVVPRLQLLIAQETYYLRGLGIWSPLDCQSKAALQMEMKTSSKCSSEYILTVGQVHLDLIYVRAQSSTLQPLNVWLNLALSLASVPSSGTISIRQDIRRPATLSSFEGELKIYFFSEHFS